MFRKQEVPYTVFIEGINLILCCKVDDSSNNFIVLGDFNIHYDIDIMTLLNNAMIMYSIQLD